VKRREETQGKRKSKEKGDDHESNVSNAIGRQCYRRRRNPGFDPHLLDPCSSPGPSDISINREIDRFLAPPGGSCQSRRHRIFCR